MRWFVIAVALGAAGAAGCRDREVAALADIKTKLCACKTAACAEELMQTIPQRDTRSTPRTQELAQQILDCLAKLEIVRPSNDPDDDQGSQGSGVGSAPTGSGARASAGSAGSDVPR